TPLGGGMGAPLSLKFGLTLADRFVALGKLLTQGLRGFLRLVGGVLCTGLCLARHFTLGL
ncbi:hypothetical protein, partial [Pseudomonas aeruginosa]|uniref:hypothetical protein n=1 Tax=Pseudomonas aeruginosa TaxID=287 RepID=UPI002F94F14C